MNCMVMGNMYTVVWSYVKVSYLVYTNFGGF